MIVIPDSLTEEEKLAKAKVILYRLLLHKDVALVTETEADLMFALASDPDIQKVLKGVQS